MRIIIAHDASEHCDSIDIRDVLVQAQAVRDALVSLGHRVENLSCTFDLREAQNRLKDFGTEMVFNLVESLDGQGRLIHLFPSVLDARGLPYTGAPAEAVLVTSNKVMAKQWMSVSGLPTPPWQGPHPASIFCANPLDDQGIADKTWIIKSMWEHASIGLDASSLAQVENRAGLMAVLESRCRQSGGVWFAEQYIDGREFNLAILAGADGPEVLPPAEIVFEGYAENMPRIVDYKAKWDEGSYEFHHTPRRFDFPETDRELLSELKAIAIRCWHVFGLGGYARVDFRVDQAGRPWILEINTNPCLSPDAGYAAALAQGGVTFTEAVQRILEDAFRKVM
jgi:D-alanine-D-alanine ligase